ncbi:MAG: sugar transferase [Hydrogenoanaerobacterium sp.]
MYLFFKRLFDIILSGISIIILLPILLLIAVCIKCGSQGPIFFQQKRIKMNKQFFKILKFRTMYIDAPKDMPTHLLNHPDAYITPIGKFLRKTSLDELPQLFNIFCGDMAIVGPRPALWNQDDLIAERDKYGANNVPVGLTGWAQVNGRDELPIEVKAKLDGDYAQHNSFFFDIKIILLTVANVFKAKGVVEGGTSGLEQGKQAVEEKK